MHWRRHVHHLLDAVDLLLDHRGHAVGHHLAVRAGVAGRHLHAGGRDVRILRHRQREHRHAAQEKNDNRNHPGKNRAFDKEFGEHRLSLLVRISPRRHGGTESPNLYKEAKKPGKRIHSMEVLAPFVVSCLPANSCSLRVSVVILLRRSSGFPLSSPAARVAGRRQ